MRTKQKALKAKREFATVRKKLTREQRAERSSPAPVAAAVLPAGRYVPEAELEPALPAGRFVSDAPAPPPAASRGQGKHKEKPKRPNDPAKARGGGLHPFQKALQEREEAARRAAEERKVSWKRERGGGESF